MSESAGAGALLGENLPLCVVRCGWTDHNNGGSGQKEVGRSLSLKVQQVIVGLGMACSVAARGKSSR